MYPFHPPRYFQRSSGCIFFLAFLLLWQDDLRSEDSLPRLTATPRSLDAVWRGYDPTVEPIEDRTVREWTTGELTLRHVTYRIGTFRGKPATMAAFYGFPTGRKNLPALVHFHGGGQRAFQAEVRRFAARGYAVLSINWGGREMESAREGDPNTDWGAVDPTQNNVGGYSNLLPGPQTVDPFPSARNNNWFLLAVAGRRAITFLQQQAEVDGNRIGIYGHSMGGRLTGLVAGVDRRVRAASPSVGGSGFLQTDLWGLSRSARRVRGDLELFQKTMAGQAYLERIQCPLLFLSATNDFNAPLEFVGRGMKLAPSPEKRLVLAPHLNHRFTPATEISRPLWLDAHLLQRLEFPTSPRIQIQLKTESGIPTVQVTADSSRPVERVELYYGYARDPRNRFWARSDPKSKSKGKTVHWQFETPLFDLEEPLFVHATVYYRLDSEERQPGDPASFALSAMASRYPEELVSAGCRATEKRRDLIEDFQQGMRNWYLLNAQNRHHWLFGTRKLADPRWEAPAEAELILELMTSQPDNRLAVQIMTDQWRSYAGKKKQTWIAFARAPEAGQNRIRLGLGDFNNAEGETLPDWAGITELILCAADKARDPRSASKEPWQGEVPVLKYLAWQGKGEIKRPKPYLSADE